MAGNRLALLTLVGLLCVVSGPSAQTTPVDYEKDIQPIWTASCATAGCHVPGGSGPMSLAAGVSYANLLTPASPISPRVIAKDPAKSYLVQRIEGTSPPQMPLGKTPLPQAQIDLIKRWITEGALAKAATTQPPTSTVPDPAKQDSTKLGVWLDLNTASGNQMAASGSALPGSEITVQVYGRNLTPATSYGVTLTYDATVLTFVTAKFQPGTYLSGGISLPAQATGGTATFGVALLGGSPVSGSGLLGTAVFTVGDKFASGYTEIKVKELKLGTAVAAIQTSNAIVKALQNTPPVAKVHIKPEALKEGNTKSLITLDASGSSDPDGDPITVKWTASTDVTFKKSTSDTSRVAQVQVPESTKSNVTFTLTVTDKNGAKATATDSLRILPKPSAASSVTVDLDPAADDQGADLHYGVVAGDLVTLQVFTKDLKDVTGYTVKVAYDSTKLGTATYANGPLISGTFIPLTQTGKDFVQGGGSTLPATASAGSGLLCTFTFKVKAGFEGSASLSVTSINLQQGTARNEVITTPVGVEITSDVPVKAAPAASFDEDGDVDFDDFFQFTSYFGLKKGDPGYEARFDLDADNEIGFGDFFIFIALFGVIEE